MSELRAALEEAYEEHDEDTTETVTPEADTGQKPETPVVESEPSENAGGEGTAEGEAVADEEHEAEVKAEEAKELPSSKAPASWKPAAREDWAKVPEAVRTEIIRRERDMERGLQDSAQARRVADAYTEAVRPFESIIAMENANPVAAVRSLLATAAQLRMGTPQQKAQMISQIISQYGVDVMVLDSVLAGAPLPQGGQQQPNQQLEQELAPIKRFMSELQNLTSQNTQKRSTQSQATLQAFSEDSANEFFMDVRESMADIFELAGKRGRELTLKQAYDQAIALDPELSKIVGQRKQAQASGTVTKAKRNAASSIHGTPGGGKAQGSGKDLRSTIEAAMENGGNN